MNAGLSGEPENALLIERRRIEVSVGELPRQREQLDLASRRIDASDRILPTLGDPWRAVRSDDDAMGRGAGPKWNVLVLAGLRIEAAENAFLLPAVPDRAVRRRRHVMRIVARRQLIEGRLRGETRCSERARKRRNHGGDESHPRLPRQIAVLPPPTLPSDRGRPARSFEEGWAGRPRSQRRPRALSGLDQHQAKTLRRCFPRYRATTHPPADNSSPPSPLPPPP